jgi:uncharacterized membrane protein YqjE
MSAAAPEIIGRGKSLLDQLLRLAQTRLELLSAEIQRERLLVVRQLWLAAGVLLCGWLASSTLILWVVLTVPAHRRPLVLGSLVLILLLAGIAGAIALHRRSRRPALFSRVVHQLRLDRASLSDPGSSDEVQ